MRIKIESAFAQDEPQITFAKGSLTTTQDGFLLEYNEPSDDGLQFVTVELSDNRAVITRPAARMVIEKDTPCVCPYKTVAGVFDFEFIGKEIDYKLDDKGGIVSLSYAIKNGGEIISDATITITVKE